MGDGGGGGGANEQICPGRYHNKFNDCFRSCCMSVCDDLE